MTRGRFVPVSGEWSPRVEEALAATDWTATPVVDVVRYAPATTRGFEDGQPRTELYRYAEPPPLDAYETGERTYRVERVTRPVYDGLTSD